MEYKIEKFKGAEVLRADDGVKLVKFMNFQNKKDNLCRVLSGEREIVLFNMDQQLILRYKDSWDKNYFNKSNTSLIYCYKEFFVRQIEDFKKYREDERICAYLVYDYNGNLLGKEKGLWLKKEWENVEDWRE